MKSNRTRTIAAMALALVGSMVASSGAQLPSQMPSGQGGGGSDHHFLRIGFGGGMSVPTNHAADALKNGVNGEGYVLIDLGLLPPIRLNLGYQRFDYKQLLGGQPAGQTSILSGGGGLSITVIPFGPIRPYVTAGVGAFHVSDDLQNAATTGSTTGSASGSTPAPSTPPFKFGIDGGAGVRIKFGRLEAFAEGRVQNIYTDQGVIDRKTITAIPVSFGILF